jgi:RND family efflux transporter MFP subunit
MLNRRTLSIAAVAASSILLAGCPVAKKEKVKLGFADEDTTATTTHTTGTVELISVQVAQEPEYLRLTGSLVADEKSEVATNVGGIVQEVLVERGAVVDRGDVLVRIDPVDAENRLAEGTAGVEELAARLGMRDPNRETFDPAEQPEVHVAKAGLDLAAANYQRDADLFQKRVIAKADFDRSKSEYDAAKERHQQAWHQSNQLFFSLKTARVRLRSLQKSLEDTTVTAPFAGMVAEKHTAPGEMLMSGPMGGSKVVTLVKIDPLRLVLSVPAQYVASVQAGQVVEFVVEAFPGKTFQGEVTYVAPALEQASRSLTVEAIVPNADQGLRPGLFATARLMLPSRHQVFYVPESAVRRSGDISRVMVVRDSIAREQVVTVGDTTDGRVRVRTGLAEGDIVVADASAVTDGMKVR